MIRLRTTRCFVISLLVGLFFVAPVQAQNIWQIQDNGLTLIHFGKRFDYLLPHVVQTYHNARQFHGTLWDYPDSTDTYVILSDFEDMGHGGALVMPFSQVQLGVAPYSFAFSIIPSNERFQWLFNHELTHVVMADKTNPQDRFFRSLLQGKIRRNEENPLSAFWSYLTTPRWYAPRWFHEGIACFMETWMSGGLGRAMGTYDEMYFRSIVNGGQRLYSLIGLETEGTTIDFQVGANAYLYGSRFITYLAYAEGVDKLKAFYSRSDSSKAFYAQQFKQVYGRSIHQVWKEWMEWERAFQEENLARIKAYPLSPFRSLTDKPLGNVSKLAFNPSTGKLYAAINYPGILSQVAEIDVQSGRIRKLATLDSPELYYSTHLAYNAADEKVYFTEQNSKFRSLVEVDVRSGRKKTLHPMTRTGNLVFNPTDKSLWGVRHDNGNATLVTLPAPYDKIVPVYTAPFGRVLFDLTISHGGDKLVASLSGVKGEQALVCFDLNRLKQGDVSYETLFELEDNTLTQFSFSSDDRYLIGTSYFTGVSNVWRLNVATKEFELLSNTATGLFSPLQYSADSLVVLRFERDGMVPGVIPYRVLSDANAIEYLGNQVHQRNPVVEQWSLPPASKAVGASTDLVSTPYRPLREMKLANLYPDIGGYKQTVALGCRLNWRDPLGVSNLELFVAGSPWSPYENKQKVHLMLDWRYFNWHLTANFNQTHFYDLFGPTKRSRAGYVVGLDYRRNFSQKHPFKRYYEAGLYTYGMLEVLPQYQNVASPIRAFQAAHVGYGLSKLRKTLGGVMDETGYSWDISATSYLAQGRVYPSFVSNQDVGFLLPGLRNTSFWIRNSVGQSLGLRASGLSHFYFGGFRNNYVDWQPSEQYRLALAFPGAPIDDIKAYNYVKTMGELNLRPLRLRNVGTTWLYPTFIKSSLFGTHLMTNFDRRSERAHLFNLGAQVDLQLVLFSYLKTTWSLGYARKLQAHTPTTDQWMLSLKLLGD